MKNVLTLLALALCLWSLAEAKTITGTVRTYNKFKIIGSFVFDDTGGRVKVNFSDHTKSNNTVAVLYSDEEDSWYAIQDVDNDNCEFKISKSKWSGSIKSLTGTTFRVSGVRPRTWYIGVANCKGLIDADYTITFLNQESGTWYKHFGWDEKGMFEMSIVFFLLQFVITCFYGYLLACVFWEKMKKTVAVTHFLASLTEMIGLFFLMIHYSVYSFDGVGVIGLERTYVYLDMFSQMCFLIAIYTIVRGWPAGWANVTANQAIGMSLFILNLLCYVLLFSWYTADSNSITSLYLYDSIPGYIVIAVRALTFVWCQYELFTTLRYEKEDSRKLFFVIYAVFITFWFLYMPINAIVSHYLAPWVRQKFVYGIIFTLNTIAYLFPLVIFFPIRRNPFFYLIDNKGKADAYSSSTNNSQTELTQA